MHVVICAHAFKVLFRVVCVAHVPACMCVCPHMLKRSLCIMYVCWAVRHTITFKQATRRARTALVHAETQIPTVPF